MELPSPANSDIVSPIAAPTSRSATETPSDSAISLYLSTMAFLSAGDNAVTSIAVSPATVSSKLLACALFCAVKLVWFVG